MSQKVVLAESCCHVLLAGLHCLLVKWILGTSDISKLMLCIAIFIVFVFLLKVRIMLIMLNFKNDVTVLHLWFRACLCLWAHCPVTSCRARLSITVHISLNGLLIKFYPDGPLPSNSYCSSLLIGAISLSLPQNCLRPRISKICSLPGDRAKG